MNQVPVLALLDWQLLCQVSENAVLHPFIYWCLENFPYSQFKTKNINSLIFISTIIK